MDRLTASGREQARADYSTALNKESSYYPARVNLAILLQAEGRFMAAWNLLTGIEGVEKEQDKEEEGEGGGRLRIQGDGGNKRRRGRREKNQKLKKPTNEVIEEHKPPELSPPILATRGVISLQMGHLSGAMLDLSQAIQDAPSAETFTNRGVVQQFMGYLPAAMLDYQQALKFNPSYCHAHYNIGNLLFSQRQFRAALKSFSQALGGNLDDAVMVNRGLTRMMLDKEDGAMADLTAAVEKNPEAAHAFFNRGNLWRSKGQLKYARDDYTRGIIILK